MSIDYTVTIDIDVVCNDCGQDLEGYTDRPIIGGVRFIKVDICKCASDRIEELEELLKGE